MCRILLCCLLFSTTSLQAQLNDYFSVLAGGVRVVQDDYTGASDNSTDNWGLMLALSRTYPIWPRNAIGLALEVSYRESNWDRYFMGEGPANVIDPKIATHEFAFSPQLVHSPAVDRARYFLHSGPEISIVRLRESPYYYDDSHWNDVVLSLTFGGGILVPVADKEIVIDVRYNSDMTKAVDDREYWRAPIGSRFDELHLLFGINLPTRFFRIRN